MKEAAVVVVEGMTNEWGDKEDLRESMIREEAKADWFGDRSPLRLSLPLVEGGKVLAKVEMRSWMAADSLRKLAAERWNGRVRPWAMRGTQQGSAPTRPQRPQRRGTDREGFTYVGPRGDKRTNSEKVEDQKRRAAGCYRCGKPGHFARDCRATNPWGPRGPQGKPPARK